MTNFLKTLALAGLFLFTQPVLAATPAGIEGIWLTEDKDSAVEFYPCQETLCGRLYWLGDPDPGPTTRAGQDEKNPDPEKRTRPLCGMKFMGGFEKQDDGSYESGWLYSPRHGSMFSAKLTLVDDTRLKLRGYMGFEFMGEDQLWERAPKNVKRCVGLLPVDMAAN